MRSKVTLTPGELWGLRDAGFTLKQLAEHMGVTRQRISQLIDRADFMVEVDVWECGHEPTCEPYGRDVQGLRQDIYALRLRGMRAGEIAAELGISKQRVWQVESGSPESIGPPPGSVLRKGGTPVPRPGTPQQKAG